MAVYFQPIKSELSFKKEIKNAAIDFSNYRNYFLEPFLVSRDIIEAAQASDNESLALIGEVYHKDEFWLEFLKEFRQDSSLVGTFRIRVNDTMIFDSGSSCRKKKDTQSLTLHLICNSKNRLINVIEKNECEFESSFASPIACDERKLEMLNASSVDELKTLYRSLKTKRF